MMFLETIRLENGEFHLLDLHQQRMTSTIREVYGAAVPVPDIALQLSNLGGLPTEGIYKCRLLYDAAIQQVELAPYTQRTVNSLKIVEAYIDYHLKSSDRTHLQQIAAQKGDCDEVMITRQGLITDSSYTNFVFHGTNGLYTPRHPLLQGVMRQHLLNRGIIREMDLTVADILPDNPLGITAVSLINAMLPLETAPKVVIQSLHKS